MCYKQYVFIIERADECNDVYIISHNKLKCSNCSLKFLIIEYAYLISVITSAQAIYRKQQKLSGRKHSRFLRIFDELQKFSQLINRHHAIDIIMEAKS